MPIDGCFDNRGKFSFWRHPCVSSTIEGHVPLNVRTGPVSSARLRHEYPGVLPWWLAHLTLTTVIAILAITIAVEVV
jgi:hypothetical protein